MLSGESALAATPATLVKTFGAGSITVGQSTSLTFTLVNPNAGSSLTGLSFTDTLPSGMVVSTPNGLTATCAGGTVTATAGASVITVSGETLASNAFCTIQVNVTVSAAALYTNTTSAITSNEAAPGIPASASITANAPTPATLAKTFGAGSITVGQSTSLTFTLANPNAGISLTGLSFNDTLPAGMVVSTPNGLTATCAGGTVTGTAGTGLITVNGEALGPNAFCTIQVNVTISAASLYTNTTSAITSNQAAPGSAATATITANAATAPALSQAFGAGSINIGQSTSLTYTLINPNAGLVVTGVSFTNNLPAGLVVATPNGLTATCAGGAVTATAGSGTATVSGETLAANSSCTIAINVTATTSGVKINTTSTVTSTNAGTGSQVSASLTVNAAGSTTTALISSANPSNFGTSVTFTATVTATGGGGTPTGSVTFQDGATTIATVTLASGAASFATASLAAGSHSITARYGGSAGFSASTVTLTQVVSTALDSIRLRTLQIAATGLELQASGAATSAAISEAIADGFSENGGPFVTANGSGMHFNFAADPGANSGAAEGPSNVDGFQRGQGQGMINQTDLPPQLRTPVPEQSNASNVSQAFAALGYAAPMLTKAAPQAAPREWLFWGDVRGTGWNTTPAAADITGAQVNAFLGVTRKLTPDFQIGVFAGFEDFRYTSQTLNGLLKGDGWSAGGYLGWRIWQSLRFDAAVARSGIYYSGASGAAAATFPGQRWIVSSGLTGMYQLQRFEIEPSARVYALWENENSYIDSLGTLQGTNNFSNGRASGGVKVAYPFYVNSMMRLAPYGGVYADYYFTNENNQPLLLPTEFIQGWSARLTSGLAAKFTGGTAMSLGGEVGGLGSGKFTNFTVNARGSVPF